ncbi:ABC transporter permease [Streptococcus salivarius]|uniref:FtsX-like permease family protein n=1 Tax=Streptococcus salivarius TaxID=1304 RepID=UPI0005364201|nr:FtsX-like permease family protein [Streptococcus salivarius]AIY21687.1 ABC transporter permease [Streptococcus salivarius]AMB83398.1 ABC transporter permease [Streptococcus salivarius]WMS35088.1 FtsX-like permease family protein [Streptococcus salivarius]SHM44652.1 putative ABC transport system permease protein [Streptococcus salivarius]VED89863.1 ABC transporter permease [Streptococcus salivarius]
MKKTTYWKDVWRTFVASKGRMLSIALLMALGSFALIGLKVTSPNMKKTGEHFFKTHQTADLSLISTYSINQTDQDLLNSIKKKNVDIEYGYFKDAVIKGTNTAFRIFSKPKKISTYDLIEGKLPTKDGEIALSSTYKEEYSVGDKINFSEPVDSSGQKQLKEQTYTITGFVNSSELLSRNRLGNASAGTGKLDGYAIVPETDFTSNDYMIARIRYKDLENVSPFSEEYANKISERKAELKELFKDEPEKRLAEIKSQSQAQITQAKQELETALAQTQQMATSNPAEAANVKEATTKIEAKQKELEESQAMVDNLPAPSYQFYSRREIPGSEGYVAYESNINIIHDVSNIFPVALYFMAALVTFVTMGRFVEEERGKAGIFNALGYSNSRIIHKFVIYGLITSITGTTAGVITGHTLLPILIHNTYKSDLLLPAFELHFYLGLTLVAFLLGLLSAVLPAFAVAKKELWEKPSQLLLPKPPRAGAKIVLERITPLWKRLSFTEKVTMRNIFRYKQRMFMTLFGVAGLGIRSSVSNLNQQQFEDIIHYDMIVAKQPNTSSALDEELTKLLDSKDVKEYLNVHFETLQKIAGSNKDTQEISTLVFNDRDDKLVDSYVSLHDRDRNKTLKLSNDGAIISEKMAKLLNLKVGDTITVQNSQDESVKIKIAGITEMYMGHFLFMNASYYQKAFGTPSVNNANLVTLAEPTKQNVENMAAKFINLPNVYGVVQNNNLKLQISTMVNSLTQVIGILITVSILLAVVVLHNLTNINVSERIHELSTVKVLGFYNNEVSLYIYRETIYLSIIGIFVGFGLGQALHHYMVSIIPPDRIMFDPSLGLATYLLPAVLIGIILIILGFVVNKRLAKLNMLEALSSVE